MKTIVFAFALAMCAFTANCKTSDDVNTPFKYPFSQGDAKWKEFKTPQERIAALQIPDNSLSLISTEDLLLICLDFPYLSDVFAFDDMDIGIKAVASKFNGLQEFLTRQDQIEVMKKIFQRISSDGLYLTINSDVEIGNNSTRICVLSYLLGCPEILNKTTNFQKKNLIQITQSNIDKVSQDSIYSQTLAYSALKILKQLLNGSPKTQYGDYISVTRYTPNGSPVLAWRLFQNELSVYDKIAYADYVVNNYGATIVSEATKTYNCHAYAWHMTEDGDTVWIGLTSLTDENIYWEDSSYIEVPESLATKVSYYESSDGNHSAVRISNNLYRSKWGSLPLVEHAPNTCPYNTSMPKKYYVRTPYISGPSTICGASTNTYMINYPISGCTVTWNTDNNNFSISSSSNQCFVTYTGTPQYSVANLTANIKWNGTTIKTLTKRIVMHGTDLVVYGEQESYYSSNGLFPYRSFTIPANNGSRNIHERINREVFADKESLPINFIEDNTRDFIFDFCGYGITDINGGNRVYLYSTRFDGMEINFSGLYRPTYFYQSGGYVSFDMPYDSPNYPVTLQAHSDSQCHDFCLTFNVIPLPGVLSGDDIIWVNIDDSMLYVTFMYGGEPIGNGQFYFPSYSVTISKIPGGTCVYSNTFSGTQTSFSVNTSTWTSGIYSIRIVCNGNIYSKSICL